MHSHWCANDKEGPCVYLWLRVCVCERERGMSARKYGWVHYNQGTGNDNNNNVKLVLSISEWVGRPFNHGLKGANALYHHWTVSRANCGHISLSASLGWPTIWPARAPAWLNADKVAVTAGLSWEPASKTYTKWNRESPGLLSCFPFFLRVSLHFSSFFNLY